MKKLAIALTAIAAFTAPAFAADLAPRAPIYQPPVPVYNWTGFWISGGGGGGLWNADSNVVAFPSGLGLTRDQRLGGSGWFGTVGAGWDWQLSPAWVFGIFGDGQFGEIRGSQSDPFNFVEGREKLRARQLGGRRETRLPRRAECQFLRQRRLYRFPVVGYHFDRPRWRPLSSYHGVIHS